MKPSYGINKSVADTFNYAEGAYSIENSKNRSMKRNKIYSHNKSPGYHAATRI